MYKTLRVLLCMGLILTANLHFNPTPMAKADVIPPADPLLVRQEPIVPPILEPQTEEEIINGYIHEISAKYNVDEYLVRSVVRKESNYNPKAKGDSGRSLGLMQIQPRWHAKRAASLGVTDLRDPYGNILVGVDYLADLLELYSPELALMVYNSGPSYASKMHSRGIVSGYAREVLALAKQNNGGD